MTNTTTKKKPVSALVLTGPAVAALKDTYLGSQIGVLRGRQAKDAYINCDSIVHDGPFLRITREIEIHQASIGEPHRKTNQIVTFSIPLGFVLYIVHALAEDGSPTSIGFFGEDFQESPSPASPADSPST